MQTVSVSRNGIRWGEVAAAMGANLVESDRNEAQVYLHRGERGRRFILTDNGGELNVSEIVAAAPSSVPYRRDAGMVGPVTLANRLLCAIDGEAIDYSFTADDDEAVTP
jgi:hypothetical protein